MKEKTFITKIVIVLSTTNFRKKDIFHILKLVIRKQR
jgi:hypothetical protein